MFPIVVDLRDRPVVVVGAGEVGARKTAQLVDAGARVRVIAERALAPLPEGVESVEVRRYRDGDLEGTVLAVAATGDDAVNDAIVDEARRRGVWLNVVDDLARSSFHFTAVHRDGDVVVSVSTNGASPALAQWVRDRVARALPTNLAGVARQLRLERQQIHQGGESTEGREWRSRVQALVEDD